MFARLAYLGKWASVAICALSGAALAVTQPLEPLELPEDIDALRIEDLTVRDPLGFDCIREEHIDLAFHASGKGLRLPRTCLPEPCADALTPFRLAALIGRQPTEGEWDQYIARYADFCRKEVVPFAAPDAPVADAVLPEAAFWLPLLAQVGPGGGSPTGGTPVVSPSGGGGGGGFGGGGGGTTPGGGGPFVLNVDSDDDTPGGGTPGGGGQPVGVTPVPLPAGLWLLLGGIAGLAGLRRRRAHSAPTGTSA